MNRAEKRRQQKLAKKAAKKQKTGVVTAPPSTPVSPSILKAMHTAVQHHVAGRLSEAEQIYQGVLQADPNNPDALHLLGVMAHQLGKHDVAIELISKALDNKPHFAEAHNNLGNALKQLGKLEEALSHYRQALSIKPNYVDAHYNLGICFQDLGEIENAVECYEKTLSIKADHDQALNNLGNAHKLLGHLDEAAACYRKAIDANPNYGAAYNNLGTIQQDMGELDEARASYRKALKLTPGLSEAYRHLSTITTFEEGDAEIPQIEAAYTAASTDSEQKMNLAFTLGKIFDDLKQYDRAFDFYAAGNALRRAQFDFSIEDRAAYYERIKAAFDQESFSQHANSGCDDETPVFIVGMPRSGTSLVEQILASHSLVHGGGELKSFSRAVSKQAELTAVSDFPELVQSMKDEDFARLGQRYVDEVRKHSSSARFITDKLPDNYIYIGLIKLALPNAKIIHCHRNAADTGLSLFKSFFPDPGIDYAYDLGEIGRHIALYEDLMAYWDAVVPGSMHTIQYGELVTDQERQSRALIEFCGLEWEDACLNFHKTKRAVQTASSGQVRKPIYTSSVDAWKRYETHLAPLLDALEK